MAPFVFIYKKYSTSTRKYFILTAAYLIVYFTQTEAISSFTIIGVNIYFIFKAKENKYFYIFVYFSLFTSFLLVKII